MSFNVELTNCEDENEAIQSIMGNIVKMYDDDRLLEVNFELLEEKDMDYSHDDEELQELNF